VPEATVFQLLASRRDARWIPPRDPGVSLADSLDPRLPSATPPALFHAQQGVPDVEPWGIDRLPGGQETDK
jgi:hypothetical protein